VNNQYASGNSTQAMTTANLTVDFGNAASDINPADIETISVLKALPLPVCMAHVPQTELFS